MLCDFFISIKKISSKKIIKYFMTCENYMTEFSMSTDKLLLENSHTHLFTCSLRLLSHCNYRVEKLQQRLHSSQNWKYLLSGPSQQEFANHWSILQGTQMQQAEKEEQKHPFGWGGKLREGSAGEWLRVQALELGRVEFEARPAAPSCVISGAPSAFLHLEFCLLYSLGWEGSMWWLRRECRARCLAHSECSAHVGYYYSQ